MNWVSYCSEDSTLFFRFSVLFFLNLGGINFLKNRINRFWVSKSGGISLAKDCII